jgi:hypothetical protein
MSLPPVTPTSAAAPAAARERLRPGRCVAQGWAAFRRNPGLALAMNLVYLVVIAIQVVPFIGWLGGLLVQPPAQGGLARLGLNLLGDRAPSSSDFTWGFSRWWSFVAYYLLAALAVLFACLPGFLAIGLALGFSEAGFDLEGPARMWGVLYFVVAAPFICWIAVRWMFGPFVLADEPRVGAFDAFRISWNITRGSFWRLVGLMVLLVLIVLLGLVALIVGYFVALPVMWLAVAAAYRTLKPRGAAVAAPAPLPATPAPAVAAPPTG